jgi:hypothetical protein
MPKMVCSSGNILRFGDIPYGIQYNFISDVDYDKIQGQVDAEELLLKMKMFFVCED